MTKPLTILVLLCALGLTAAAQTKKLTPEQSINSAPTLTPVFKVYCRAWIRNDEIALRSVYSADTLKGFYSAMAKERVKSLLKYLKEDMVSGKLCEIRNEQIQGETAVAEIRGDSIRMELKSFS